MCKRLLENISFVFFLFTSGVFFEELFMFRSKAKSLSLVNVCSFVIKDANFLIFK